MPSYEFNFVRLLIFFILPLVTQFNVTGEVELVDDEDDTTGSATAEAATRTGANGSTGNGTVFSFFCFESFV